MQKCPECNKVIGDYDLEVEIEDEEYKQGILNVEVRVVLQCDECEADLKEKYISLENKVVCPTCGSSGLYDQKNFEHKMPIINDTLKEGEEYIIKDDQQYFENGQEVIEYYETEGEDWGKDNIHIESYLHCKICGQNVYVNFNKTILRSDMDDLF